MTVGDCCFNFCALAAGFNLEVATELFNSFSYARDTDADRPRSRRVIQHSFEYSVTFVTDHDDDSIEVLLNPYLSFAGSRMEVNVCETSLNDAEDRKFGFLR
jgi:hypothetical protein